MLSDGIASNDLPGSFYVINRLTYTARLLRSISVQTIGVSIVNTPPAKADGFSGKLCGNPLAWRPKAGCRPESSDHGFNRWPERFSMQSDEADRMVPQDKRYRLRLPNASDIDPLHLHRYSFEVVRVGDKSAACVFKDVVMLGGCQDVQSHLAAHNPGLTLVHRHQELHMDSSFMALSRYA